jgi:hypothetical protein
MSEIDKETVSFDALLLAVPKINIETFNDDELFIKWYYPNVLAEVG